MNKRKIICCAFILFSVFVIISECVTSMQPIVKVNGYMVRRYEYENELKEYQELIVADVTDSILLYQFANNLGVDASDDEVKQSAEVLMNERKGISKHKASKMARDGIVIQKCIDYFAGKVQPDADEVKAYYENNKELYGDEPDYESIKQNYQMEMGEKMYESKLEEFKSKAEIKNYR